MLYDDPIKHINDAKDKEESVTTCDVTVLNIHLPQLIRSGHHMVLGQSTRMLAFLYPLLLKNASS